MKVRINIIVLLTLSIYLVFSVGIASASVNTHEPIHIIGNENLTTANGVVNPEANGTENDPYIIENWIIDASQTHGILIELLNENFIIRNCIIENGKENSSHGIVLNGVTNGKVENNLIKNNKNGVYLRHSPANVLENNQAENNKWNGFSLRYSSNNNFLKNNQSRNNHKNGFKIKDSLNNFLKSNTAKNNGRSGFSAKESSSTNLVKNMSENNSNWAFYIESSPNSLLKHNIFIEKENSVILRENDRKNNFILLGENTFSFSIIGNGEIILAPLGEDSSKWNKVKAEAHPQKHYSFDNWAGDFLSSDAQISFEIDSDKKIVANFSTCRLAVSIHPSDGGSVELNPPGRNYRGGTQVELTANPNEGYEFDHWSGDFSGDEKQITFTMNSDDSVIANFSEKDSLPLTWILISLLPCAVIASWLLSQIIQSQK